MGKTLMRHFSRHLRALVLTGVNAQLPSGKGPRKSGVHREDWTEVAKYHGSQESMGKTGQRWQRTTVVSSPRGRLDRGDKGPW